MFKNVTHTTIPFYFLFQFMVSTRRHFHGIDTTTSSIDLLPFHSDCPHSLIAKNVYCNNNDGIWCHNYVAVEVYCIINLTKHVYSIIPPIDQSYSVQAFVCIVEVSFHSSSPSSSSSFIVFGSIISCEHFSNK